MIGESVLAYYDASPSERDRASIRRVLPFSCRPMGDHMTVFMLLLAGLLLCNCIPHLARGLQGDVFPTPFARPRGIGNSPPLVNFLWGTANLALGVLVLMRWLPAGAPEFGLLAVLAGFLAGGTFMALHFARKVTS